MKTTRLRFEKEIFYTAILLRCDWNILGLIIRCRVLVLSEDPATYFRVVQKICNLFFSSCLRLRDFFYLILPFSICFFQKSKRVFFSSLFLGLLFSIFSPVTCLGFWYFQKVGIISIPVFQILINCWYNFLRSRSFIKSSRHCIGKLLLILFLFLRYFIPVIGRFISFAYLYNFLLLSLRLWLEKACWGFVLLQWLLFFDLFYLFRIRLLLCSGRVARHFNDNILNSRLYEIVADHVQHRIKLFSLFVFLHNFAKIKKFCKFNFSHRNFGAGVFCHEHVVSFVESRPLEKFSDYESTVVLRWELTGH